MRKIFRFGLFSIIVLYFSSCGGVGDADLGDTVIVTADIKNNHIEQDIASNNDGSCTYSVDNL